MNDERFILGCMTGTSLDGLDVALTQIRGRGLGLTARCVAHRAAALPASLRGTLGRLAAGEALAPRQILRAARHLGVVHAEVGAGLMRDHLDVRLDAVVAHGQTICHAPDDGLSWQLFDPWPLVRALKVAVAYDLRQADLVAGGQGAPITPLADWVLFRAAGDAVVNLGGIVNVTRLATTPQAVRGADVGPANLLLDGLCAALCGEPFDYGGARARAGRPDALLMTRVYAAVHARLTDRTLGREQFGSAWAARLAQELSRDHRPPEVLAAAARVVAQVATGHPTLLNAKRWLLAGGGVHNAALTAAFAERAAAAGASVRRVDEAGVPAQAREAVAFAVLGALSQDGQPATLPGVTGAQEPGVAGAWAFPPVAR